MATYFGEVIGLSSRAVSDDDDDDDEETSEFFAVTLDYKQPEFDQTLKKCQGDETIIFVIGEAASAFCKSYLLSDEFEKVAEIKARYRKDAKPEYLGQLFRSKQQQCVTVCEIREDVKQEYYFSLSQTLCEICFSASDGTGCSTSSIILTSGHTSSYKDCVENVEPEETFIRCLATLQYMDSFPVLNAAYLFSPNMMAGLPAALMTYCEVRQKKAILYVCYSESFNSHSVKAFEKVLNNNPLISGTLQFCKDAARKLEGLFNLRWQTVSNLYT